MIRILAFSSPLACWPWGAVQRGGLSSTPPDNGRSSAALPGGGTASPPEEVSDGRD